MATDALMDLNNVTNQSDPESKRCRVFLGNLNTVKMSKQELETRFMRYGHIKGISVHKGFAFVQYTSEASARLAVNNEDQKVYYGMIVDANIASEPKGRRKMTSNNRDNRVQHSLFGPAPMKRPRLDIPNNGILLPGQPAALMSLPVSGGGGGNLVALVSPSHATSDGLSAARKVVSMLDKNSKDVLVCGNCKEVFEQLDQLINHKLAGCRLRFTCRCKHINEPSKIICIYCTKEIPSSWELIQHCEAEHDITICAAEPENEEKSIEEIKDDESESSQPASHDEECEMFPEDDPEVQEVKEAEENDDNYS